ncbi:PD-(D/E)XK nuclease family protein [Actinomadura graeca]|uniref:PD-(D/E)XK nuclease family protein n=1 Tax=Actinomadura graeca TaxID=2750812 RepID=A0ABX8QM78_9ACTN|nr:PD-(D/E)XK nuclease family protein [Actinomadura graeca]QXJ19651.1 PD-(D/E)XK nuclease family protein [Actinomadura graeca]
MDPQGAALARWVAELIYQRGITASRSLAHRVGPSALGTACDRQLAYAASGTPRLNFEADPWAALVGNAIHTWQAELFRALDAGSGRFLVESTVTYRNVSGTADLYDRRERIAIDWKTTKKNKIRTIRRSGKAPQNYVTQLQTYGAGLAAGGERPERVALVWLPVDGGLGDIFAWVAPFDQAIADAAVDRLGSLRGLPPRSVAATPSRLCAWCDWYQPGGGQGCPGNGEEAR